VDGAEMSDWVFIVLVWVLGAAFGLAVAFLTGQMKIA
jgi:hypothetical protein